MWQIKAIAAKDLQIGTLVLKHHALKITDNVIVSHHIVMGEVLTLPIEGAECEASGDCPNALGGYCYCGSVLMFDVKDLSSQNIATAIAYLDEIVDILIKEQ